jgi:hypothetical protein
MPSSRERLVHVWKLRANYEPLASSFDLGLKKVADRFVIEQIKNLGPIPYILVLAPLGLILS